MQMVDIDPSLGLIAEFGKLTKSTTRHIHAMRQEAIFTDGVLPARFKALAAMLWAISARCEPCAKFYVQQAVKLGATEAELGEILAVASAMGGCVGEMWALKAYQEYKNCTAPGLNLDAAPGCCET
ncbi:carboxymuconolactone decarboxylase family protein [Beijerinckiaceae bacterium]|nr:carboxymuconolactone decarboxylase family protein [Beijerinckiaceae bacterium]